MPMRVLGRNTAPAKTKSSAATDARIAGTTTTVVANIVGTHVGSASPDSAELLSKQDWSMNQRGADLNRTRFKRRQKMRKHRGCCCDSREAGNTTAIRVGSQHHRNTAMYTNPHE